MEAYIMWIYVADLTTPTEHSAHPRTVSWIRIAASPPSTKAKGLTTSIGDSETLNLVIIRLQLPHAYSLVEVRMVKPNGQVWNDFHKHRWEIDSLDGVQCFRCLSCVHFLCSFPCQAAPAAPPRVAGFDGEPATEIVQAGPDTPKSPDVQDTSKQDEIANKCTVWCKILCVYIYYNIYLYIL